MSGGKHSPGEWGIWRVSPYQGYPDLVGAQITGRDGGILVAEVAGAVEICGSVHEEHEANARLIAAAPCLLEALTELQQRWHHTIGCSSSKADHALNERACAAIAKATGQ